MGRLTSVSGAAGEYYVAARLAAMGYVVGIPRGGSPTVDLLVSTQDGEGALGIQVKTNVHAHRHVKKRNETYWEWPITVKAPKRVWHAFVDLRDWGSEGGEAPMVYIVPGDVIFDYQQRAVKEKWKMANMYLMEKQDPKWLKADDYREKWGPLEAAVKMAASSSPA